MNKFVSFCMTVLTGTACALSAGAEIVNLSSSAIATTEANIIKGTIDKPAQQKYLYLTTKAADPLTSGMWDDVICFGNEVEVTMEWTSPVTADKVKVYFVGTTGNYVAPKNVKFYKGDGFTEEIAWTDGDNTDTSGNEAWHEYVFDAPQTFSKLKFYQQADKSNTNKALFLRRLWVLNASGAVGCAHEHTTTNGYLAATCTTAGSTGTEICDECSETIRAAEVIPAPGHAWGVWTVTREATKEASGYREHTCNRCSVTEGEVIPRIADVVALRNVAVATAVGSAPTLPATVKGLNADGTLAEADYTVDWGTPVAPTAVGVTTVTGTAEVNGQTMSVTASVRAVKVSADGELVNIAPLASSMTVDIDNADEVNGNRGSFDIVAEAVNITNNWGGAEMVIGQYRKPNSVFRCFWHNNQGEWLTVTFNWGEVQSIGRIFIAACQHKNAFQSGECVLKDGSGTVISPDLYDYKFHTDNDYDYYKIDQAGGHLYVFKQPLSVSGLSIAVNRMSGNYSGFHGIEVLAGGVASVEQLSADKLSDLKVDGTTVDGFAPTTYAYTVPKGKAITSVTATDNMGITVLPKFDGSAYAVTLSENGESTQKYSVLMDVEEPSGMAVIVSGPED